MKQLLFVCAMASIGLALGNTINVPAGKTVQLNAKDVVCGEVLVKTGEGTLDVTGVALNNSGIDIQAGEVEFKAGGKQPVTCRYLKWNVTKARPARSEPPEYGNSGSQFSEFTLFLNGKQLPRPPKATALNANDWCEGPQMGIDGNVKTKCYSNPFIADFGEAVTFDGYSYITANDAPGRDPFSWQMEVGIADGSLIHWLNIGGVENFEAPRERFTPVGKIFPVSLRDVVPVNYSITIGGKGRLLLTGVQETLENVSGTGLIQLDQNALVTIGADATFSGSVAGNGSVKWAKK